MILLQVQQMRRLIGPGCGGWERELVLFSSRSALGSAIEALKAYAVCLSETFCHFQYDVRLIGVQAIDEDVDEFDLEAVSVRPIEDMCHFVEAMDAGWRAEPPEEGVDQVPVQAQ